MDWSKIVNDLLASGMAYADLQSASGIPLSTLSEIRSGHTKDVKWSRGETLLSLHRDRCMAASKLNNKERGKKAA